MSRACERQAEPELFPKRYAEKERAKASDFGITFAYMRSFAQSLLKSILVCEIWVKEKVQPL